VLTFAFVLQVLALNAQKATDRTEPPVPKIFITTIPWRCVLNDYSIGYGIPLSSRHTIEYRVGWVHRNDLLHRYYEELLTSTDMRFRGPSFYVQLNKWNYTKNLRRYFWGAIAGYRYTYYHDQTLWLGGTGGSSFVEQPLLSQWRNEVYLLGSLGIQTTRFTTIEISLGVRMMHTHTHVGDTRFHPDNMTTEEYDAYRAGQVSDIPYSQGFGIQPVLRVSSRLGYFKW
jgi:hypothetical protein